MDKARQQLQHASAALVAASSSSEQLKDVQAPAIFPDLFRMQLCSPTPCVNNLKLSEAHSTLKATMECLTEMCTLRGLADFAPVIRLAEHLSVEWNSALCRGVLHNLLHPPGVTNEEELPDWAPSPRKFAQQLNLPVSLMQARSPSSKVCTGPRGVLASSAGHAHNVCCRRLRCVPLYLRLQEVEARRVGGLPGSPGPG